MNGTQRRTLVSKMHCMYSGMAKGTCRAEATLNSEKFKPIALAIVESEGIRQAVSSLAQPDLLFLLCGGGKKWSGTLMIEFLCRIPPILWWVLIGKAFHFLYLKGCNAATSQPTITCPFLTCCVKMIEGG